MTNAPRAISELVIVYRGDGPTRWVGYAVDQAGVELTVKFLSFEKDPNEKPVGPICEVSLYEALNIAHGVVAGQPQALTGPYCMNKLAVALLGYQRLMKIAVNLANTAESID